METLFNPAAYQKTLERLQNLESSSQPAWGRMTVGQMLHHSQKPFEVVLGNDDYGLKPNFLAKLFFKKAMYNDKLWSKGLPTPKQFKITDDRKFDDEMEKLKSLMGEFHAQRERTDWPPHPGFGQFSPEQIGKMQYKHLDHHLRQFEV